MHANLVTVTIEDQDEAVRMLHDEVVPMVSQAPGFVAGYWFEPRGSEGRAVVVFESEEAARGMAERARAQTGGAATITDIDTREVIANA